MSTLAVARHHDRRRKMLEQHEKEIKSVPQFDETLIPMSAMLLLAQIFGAVATQQLPLGQKAILAYAIGAPIAHASFLLCHECSHNNASPAPWINKMTAIVANGAVGVPFAISFRHYHRLHHQNQNSSEDPDMPTQLERLLLQGIGGKLFFCAFQLFFYALRPVLCFKPPPADRWIALNVTFQLAVNAAVVAVSGWDSLIYMLISTWLAGSLHPLSGHFLGGARRNREGRLYLQLLRPAEHAELQCRLPQRASRLPQHTGSVFASHTHHWTPILRQTAVVQVLAWRVD